MRKYITIIIGLLRLFKELIINAGKLKINGIKYCIGSNVKIWIHSNGYCDLGTKTWLTDFSSIEANGGNIKLGFNNFFNSNCKLVSVEEIIIGDNNLFGPNVVIVDHKHNYCDINQLICKQGFSMAPVRIGSNVWICANVVITQGVTIADHVVVAANSVVSRDLIEKGLYAGNPAVLVKKI